MGVELTTFVGLTTGGGLKLAIPSSRIRLVEQYHGPEYHDVKSVVHVADPGEPSYAYAVEETVDWILERLSETPRGS